MKQNKKLRLQITTPQKPVLDKEVDFVALKDDDVLYVQSTYMLIDEQTITREYSALKAINDNYRKIVVSLDDVKLPSQEGIEHVLAWEFFLTLKL